MFALLPAVVLILVPKRYLASKLQFMTKWVLPQSDNHRASARSRGGLADQTQQDYYQAQYMWPKELKYHKSHFVYALLPEEQNPENLEPGSAAEVQAALAHYGVFLADVAAVKGGSQRWRRRSYHGPRDAAGTGTVMPYAQPKALDGLQTAVGISGKVRAPAAVVPSCQLLPTTIGAGSKTGHAVSWEFENATGFEAFDAGCQKEVERHFQEWQSGGPARVKVSARVVVISVDFKKMTSLVDGSSRVRKIRRVRFSD
ncbi:unnamed protein product [Polarella glacialis]|nr:unnamed protein product [Polarella glacialis]